MAIFTAIATAALAGTFLAGSAIATSILAGALALGVSYAARALMGGANQPDAAKADGFSAQGKLQAAGDVPRSFQLGYSSTAGSLIYANAWGHAGETPNAFFTQVIALQDLPGGVLREIWVNGQLCSLDGTGETEMGFPVYEYRKNGNDHLWVQYRDGTQTGADAFLVNKVGSAGRPYENTRVGYGIAYVICTSLVDDTLFTGLPTFKFATSGIPLYDISKDSTAGGSGSHRWSDPTTWGGDGDNLPAVQIYNLLRGIYYNGQWLYGLQAMSAARLPAANWIAQIQKCRAEILGETGMEPTYRSGLQVTVDSQIANGVEALLTACQGRPSEIGGFYKIHLGAPDSPTFSFTDADIISTEEQSFKPFFALADSINGIAAKYPLPAEGWNTKVAPKQLLDDAYLRDGSRYLLANPSFDAVPYSAQVQRLMSSALEEAQRARTHVLTLPPSAWVLEPGDIVAWSSDRNGYISKLFRVDGVVDRANLDVGVSITEVDPSDYDWNHATDFEPVNIGPTVFERPAPQGVLDWFAVGAIIKDADGVSRRPAIMLSWDGTLPGISGVQYEVRLAPDLSHVARGRTDQYLAGSLLISQSLLPNTTYGVRGQYIPSSPRDMLWSDWLSVTTPNILVSLVEFNAGIAERVTTAIDQATDLINQLDQLKASIASVDIARNWLDKQTLRRELTSSSEITNARVTEVLTTATGLNDALAQRTLTLEASVNDPVTGIIATASYATDAFSQVHAIITGNLALSGRIESVKTTIENPTTGLSATASAVQTLQSQVSLDPNYPTSLSVAITDLKNTVNDPASGVIATANVTSGLYSVIYNGNDGLATKASASSLQTLSAQVNDPTTGIAQKASLSTVASVSASLNNVSLQYGVVGYLDDVRFGYVLQGVRRLDGAIETALLIDADQVVINGSVKTKHLAAGSVTAINMAANSVTADNGAIGSLAVKTLNIGDNAVTVIKVARDNGNYVDQDRCQLTLAVDTTGLSGKIISVLLSGSVDANFSANGTVSITLVAVQDGTRFSLVGRGDTSTTAVTKIIPFFFLYEFTASGTAQFINFAYQIGAGSANVSNLVLSATAAKR